MPSATEHQWAYDLAKELIDINGRHMTLVFDANVTSAGTAVGERVAVPKKVGVVGVQTRFTDQERSQWNTSAEDLAMLLDGQFKPAKGMRLFAGKPEDIDVDHDSFHRINNFSSVKPGELAALYRVQAVS